MSSEIETIKCLIKQYEHSFFEDHNRKPCKDDIKHASDHIKKLYKNYWKLQFEKSKKAEYDTNNEDHKDNTWSSAFNKLNVENNKRQAHIYNDFSNRTSLKKFSKKLKKHIDNQVFLPVTSPSKEASVLNSCVLGSEVPVSDNTTVCAVTNSKIQTFKHTPPEESKTKKYKLYKNSLSEACETSKKINVSLSVNEPLMRFNKTDINEKWLKRSLKNSTEHIENVNSFHTHDTSENPAPATFFSTNDKPASFNEGSNCAPEVFNEEKFSCKNDSLIDVPNHPLTHNTCIEQKMNSIKRKRLRSVSPSGEMHISKANIVCTENVDFSSNISMKKKKLKSTDVLSSPALNHCSNEVKKLHRKSKCKIEELPSSLTHETHKSERLKRKIAAGTLNENYVRVNIQKKNFSRGHKKLNIKKMKFQKWKQRYRKKGQYESGSSASSTACFKCGEVGHWARNCSVKEETSCLFPDFNDTVECDISTLEEAAILEEEQESFCQRENTTRGTDMCNFGSKLQTGISSCEKSHFASDNGIIRKNFISQCTSTVTASTRDCIKPLYNFENIRGTPKEVLSALKAFGFSLFKEGQEKAIIRILCGLSTLVILPTGCGKSLCYQLPAYIFAQMYKCITLVISPLVSLMEDQIANSSCVRAVCLNSSMSDEQKKKAVNSILQGESQILLVSPEAVVGPKGFLPSNLPPIAFACIDEVHCLSEWSHNFRPSYLQLYKALTQKLEIKCILGLTATATTATATDLAHHLNLEDYENSIIGSTSVPPNLHLSISKDEDKDWALIKLLRGDRFKDFHSVIIYCIRRNETERLAALIRTYFQEKETFVKADKKNRKSASVLIAEAYHAGLSASKRRMVQKQFMSGKLRIVIATVAFGMGLNKPDVRAVIHYNMPKSFESYVQEIGRAGRDGLDAHCHLFLSNENSDMQELKRHVYSNSIDRHTIKKLLKKIFVPCKCLKKQPDFDVSVKSEGVKCPKHEIAFSVSKAVLEFDVKEESISTLLCYLELHPKQWIHQFPLTYATCTIYCYGGSKQLKDLAEKCPAISAAIAYGKESGNSWDESAQYQFQVIDLASHMDWESGALKHQLKKLEWNASQKNKSGIIVKFSDLSFHVQALGNLTDEELDFILDFLYQKVKSQEMSGLEKLQKLNDMFHRFSYSHYWSCCDEVDLIRSDAVKEEIQKYFENSASQQVNSFKDEDVYLGTTCIQKVELLDQIRRDIQDIICTNSDQNFTGRAIARIFHGIDSPCYPAEVWKKVKRFWRCHLDVNFDVVLKIANEQLRNTTLKQ